MIRATNKLERKNATEKRYSILFFERVLHAVFSKYGKKYSSVCIRDDGNQLSAQNQTTVERHANRFTRARWREEKKRGKPREKELPYFFE